MPIFVKRPYQLVPWIGVDKSKLEVGDNILLDIDAESTLLPAFCKILIVHHGAVRVNSPPVLSRDVSIQVGSTPWLSNSLNTKKHERKPSWSSVDEYYSLPEYHYSGKKSLKFEKSEQVHENMLPSYLDVAKIENVKNNPLEDKIVGTDDLANYLNLNSFSKIDLMSSHSLEKGNLNVKETNFVVTDNQGTLRNRFRLLSKTDIDNSKKILNIKRYESNCPITGRKQVTFLIPVNENNKYKNQSSGEDLEKYEEYLVRDLCLDTGDLINHFDFKNLSHSELLSDTASLEETLKKKSKKKIN